MSVDEEGGTTYDKSGRVVKETAETHGKRSLQDMVVF